MPPYQNPTRIEQAAQEQAPANMLEQHLSQAFLKKDEANKSIDVFAKANTDATQSTLAVVVYNKGGSSLEDQILLSLEELSADSSSMSVSDLLAKRQRLLLHS